ncbi:F-box domain-containing protein [Mycena sanguinolenta]|uniref:F-box domain-containing protein n=1 Tax=Mycena sanguinolenta TaxID=230812 RepID=A0A8H6YMH1_9AGAR|nr:F-box domain-containing protein [Mycena sanguinolenta]
MLSQLYHSLQRLQITQQRPRGGQRQFTDDARFAAAHGLGMCLRWGLSRVVRVEGRRERAGCWPGRGMKGGGSRSGALVAGGRVHFRVEEAFPSMGRQAGVFRLLLHFFFLFFVVSPAGLPPPPPILWESFSIWWEDNAAFASAVGAGAYRCVSSCASSISLNAYPPNAFSTFTSLRAELPSFLAPLFALCNSVNSPSNKLVAHSGQRAHSTFFGVDFWAVSAVLFSASALKVEIWKEGGMGDRFGATMAWCGRVRAEALDSLLFAATRCGVRVGLEATSTSAAPSRSLSLDPSASASYVVCSGTLCVHRVQERVVEPVPVASRRVLCGCSSTSWASDNSREFKSSGLSAFVRAIGKPPTIPTKSLFPQYAAGGSQKRAAFNCVSGNEATTSK